MTNNELSNIIKLGAQLMALHDENSFKVKMYESATELIKNLPNPVIQFSTEELEKQDGIGKKIAAIVQEINETNTFQELEELLSKTPNGLIEMLNIKGIGIGKVRNLWKNLNIESLEQLIVECENENVANLKGFGLKTQEKVYQSALFKLENRGKILLSEAEAISEFILEKLNNFKIATIGEVARKCDIISNIQFLVEETFNFKQLDFLEASEVTSSPFIWRGFFPNSTIKIEFIKTQNWNADEFILTSSEKHLSFTKNNLSLKQFALKNTSLTDVSFYKEYDLPFINQGIREGGWELSTTEERMNSLVKNEDLKGVLHNHSLYSDGKNSIEEMALECKRLGYSYFGISDHSKSAFYANGLYEDKIEKQHHEIEILNKKLVDFKVFKGIESDILGDGNLDYSDDVLKSFDFIVASIHSNLDMDLDKAMMRLIKAIENPYTTFLGHLTGRLLLQREGYPVHHEKIIDACAANKVIIELNANPWRLDMDWKYIDYALNKNVMISINPDAHNLEGIQDMKYGVYAARKGGLTTEMCFNAKSYEEVGSYFKLKK